MSSKSGNNKTSTDSLPALRIGSRVRCIEDGVEGRIVWANGVAVKIQWDDGEQVAWRRDSLAGRPIDILDRTGEEGSSSTTAAATEAEQTIRAESPPMKPALTLPTSTEATLADSAEAAPMEAALALPAAVHEQMLPALADATAREPALPPEKKLSALNAAAQVLAEEGKPLNCQELIDAMSSRGYWTSPKGRTPQATLFSALAREITTKGASSRFVKAQRGKFALANAV